MHVAKQPSNLRWLKRAACYSSRIGSRTGASFEPTARAASRSRAPSGLQVNDELKPRGLRSAGPPASQYSLKLKANVCESRLRRQSVGVSPVHLRKAAVNELVSLNPTSSAISVTDSLRPANRSSAR